MDGWMDGITDAMDMNLGKFWEMVRDRKAWYLQSMGSQRDSHNWVTEQQQLMENCLSVIQTPLEKQYSVTTLFC